MWQNKNLGHNTYYFKKAEDVKTFFTQLFSKLNQNLEYNIYLHQIKNHYSGTTKIFGSPAIHLRVSSIINHGFNISKYSTLSGTSKLIGSTKNLNVDDLINYEYYSNLKHIAICIIAIPKYIDLNGEKIEYSSYKGKSAWDFPEDLTQEYIKYHKSKPEAHHYKYSLFDAIKQHHELPSCYLLGVFQHQKDKNLFSFIERKDHLSQKHQDDINSHDKYFGGLVKKLYEKYNTTENKEVIVQSYLEIQHYYDEIDSFEV